MLPGWKTFACPKLSCSTSSSPIRKAWSWCSKKALQRPNEETTCTGGNQPSVMAAGGLRRGQLAHISEESQSYIHSREAWSHKRKMQDAVLKSEYNPNHPKPKPSSVQSAVRSAHQESDSTATNEHAKNYQPSHILIWKPRSGELWPQKLKSHLVKIQSLNIHPIKSGVGQYSHTC